MDCAVVPDGCGNRLVAVPPAAVCRGSPPVQAGEAVEGTDGSADRECGPSGPPDNHL